MLQNQPQSSTVETKTVYWQELFTEWKQSGHSIVAFCKQRKLSTSAFYSWRNRLKNTNSQSNNNIKLHHQPTTPQPCFLPITVTDEVNPPTYQSPEFEVVYPNGCKLKIKQTLDFDALVNINKAMGVAVC